MAVYATAPLQITIPSQNPAPASFWSGEAPGFQDILDTINPLQHIPLVSTLYRTLTGDTQSSGAKLAGGLIFGGPIGFAASLFDSIIESATGSDIMGNVLAAVEGRPVPALRTASPSGHLSPHQQRTAHNAYARAGALA